MDLEDERARIGELLDGVDDEIQTTVIHWTTPHLTEAEAGRRRWDAIAVALRQRPGEWALVDEGYPHGGNTAAAAGLKKRGCEATTRSAGNGTYATWARWPNVE